MATANIAKSAIAAARIPKSQDIESVISIQEDELNNVAALLHCAVELADRSDEDNTRLIRLVKMAIAKLDDVSVSFGPFVAVV